MRRLIFREAIGGPAVEKCVVVRRSEKSKASERTCCGSNSACTVKTCANLTSEVGKNSANAARQLASGFCLPRLWQSSASLAAAVCKASSGSSRSGQIVQRA